MIDLATYFWADFKVREFRPQVERDPLQSPVGSPIPRERLTCIYIYIYIYIYMYYMCIYTYIYIYIYIYINSAPKGCRHSTIFLNPP